MKLSVLVPILLCLAACQSNPDTPAAAVAPSSEAAPPVPPKAAPATPEHIEADMLTITGLPTEEISTAQLTRQLGRPDSIAKGAVECGSRLATPVNSPAGDCWYYGETRCEVNGTQAILSSFEVTSGRFRGKVGKLVLNQNTTLEDVRRYFPKAAKEADQPAGSGQPDEVISLPFSDKGEPLDGALNLLFQNGRLRAVEFFNPC